MYLENSDLIGVLLFSLIALLDYLFIKTILGWLMLFVYFLVICLLIFLVKNKNTKIILILIAFLCLIGSIVFFIFTKGKESIWCKVGERYFHYYCIRPTGYQGRSCDKSTDCGGGYCSLVDASKKQGKGVCTDTEIGCNVWIDESGNFNEKLRMCAD